MFKLWDQNTKPKLQDLRSEEFRQTEGGYWLTPDGRDGMPDYGPDNPPPDWGLVWY